MKRKICLLALILAVLISSLPLFTMAETASVSTAQMQTAMAEAISMMEEDREEGVIVVFMKEGVTPEQAQELFINLDILSDLEDRDICRFRNYDYFSTDKIRFTLVIPEERMVELLAELNLSEIVGLACPNYIITIDNGENQWVEQEPPAIVGPDSSSADSIYDPKTTQWAMEQIKYADSWEVTDRTVLIGVLDSGYNPHEDVNCVDTNLACNFYPGSSSDDIKDHMGHGTFVIGEIGAALNGKGVNGVCKNAKIVPIKIADRRIVNGEIVDGSDLNAVCKGIEYAEDHKIRVLNLSYLLTRELSFAIKNVKYTGVLVICAGNYGDNVEGPCSDERYTYGYDNASENWIIVGATTSSGAKWSKSNYSKKYVDLFAPGYNICVISSDGKSYDYQIGTSMAAPFVAAAAAILLEANPFLTGEDVCKKLNETVTKTSSLASYCVSGGILNLAAATNSLYSDYRGAYSLGDVDGDGKVTAEDYAMVNRYVLGTLSLSPKAFKAADVDGSGEVDAIDYLLIRRFVMGTQYFPPALVK